MGISFFLFLKSESKTSHSQMNKDKTHEHMPNSMYMVFFPLILIINLFVNSYDFTILIWALMLANIHWHVHTYHTTHYIAQCLSALSIYMRIKLYFLATFFHNSTWRRLGLLLLLLYERSWIVDIRLFQCVEGLNILEIRFNIPLLDQLHDLNKDHAKIIWLFD